MIKLIDRANCLEAFPDFPVRTYDEEEDEDYYYYPEVIRGTWMRVKQDPDGIEQELLSSEISGLLKSMDIETLTFLGDLNERGWISDFSLSQDGYKPFSDALAYLMRAGVKPGYTGGIEVSSNSLNEFLQHFFVLVRCDATLPYFHFIDNQRQIIGTIHYSGDVRLDRFTENASKRIDDLISRTRFVNSVS